MFVCSGGFAAWLPRSLLSRPPSRPSAAFLARPSAFDGDSTTAVTRMNRITRTSIIQMERVCPSSGLTASTSASETSGCVGMRRVDPAAVCRRARARKRFQGSSTRAQPLYVAGLGRRPAAEAAALGSTGQHCVVCGGTMASARRQQQQQQQQQSSSSSSMCASGGGRSTLGAHRSVWVTAHNCREGAQTGGGFCPQVVSFSTEQPERLTRSHHERSLILLHTQPHAGRVARVRILYGIMAKRFCQATILPAVLQQVQPYSCTVHSTQLYV